ncbi:hypothetical protein VII00023_15176 [Vibrio ichthyoenteri ATCC 700023]|uniref:DUF2878 domain-containing protein n=1 Tax=Vibrio ichthyoenteri ATCC 700023 TaxID=870968 RepID=F9S6W8_9VIBR|nr:DUF2878 domain-containing protein [Vibrio ichthyoenteri]EGU32249.1 hypothetical protein VII00023_15176 [Vibrio ichthyoenteri ATCC 700023]
MSQFKSLLIASTWFQLIWFLAVVGSERWQWLALVCLLMTLALSVKFHPLNWQKWGALTLFGVGVDMVNASAGILIFNSFAIPLWLVVLWGMFMWYAQFLVPAVSRYPLILVSLVGGIAGSLSYIAGYKLGAVQFGYSTLFTFFWFFLVWVMVTLLCVRSLNNEKPSDA